MNKAKVKCRDIQFFSKKNNQMVCVHSREEREYARMLEEDSKRWLFMKLGRNWTGAGIPL